ncbi:MAG: S8 family serine peptidase, partial [Gammaproteobacteria bacterium]|nr:S8 family serine peptidase [Gammaproteobacteria bacterium]
ASKIAAEQDSVLAKAGAGTEKVYSYRYGMNGFAALMTEPQATRLARLPEVLNVWEDEIRPLATNFSPDYLELFDRDIGLRGPRGLDGENIIIAFIDSGVYPEHPSLSDMKEADRPRACRSSWGENTLLGRWLCRRYRRADDQLVFDPPENWNGTCQAGESFEETDCNNKLIGARWFIDGAESAGAIDSGEFRSARDVDGHGTHTATIAAGARKEASIYGTRIDEVQGMAPRARVAVYKACWLRPGDQRASCNTSDLASAIDAAVADGVDIINYSVGTSMDRISAPDDLSLLAAAKAGILSVVAAGNEGPNLGTIGSPAGGPWVITAAASSREGQTSLEAMQINEPAAIAGKYAVREASFTPPLADSDPIEASLVLADDNDDLGGAGTTSDACEALINDEAIVGNIALIQRGGCDFDVKVQNADDAGAAAVVVYNVAGDPIVMNGTSGLSDIPAVMVGQADGETFIEQLDAGETIAAVLDKGLLLTEAETGDRMASFSARGPGPVQDILKPDVSAPGVNILAGFTPDAANRTPNETFGYLSGTSMSTPHVAGVAALLMQAHPDWSPAALKSALMTTAHQSLTKSDGETQANPFDFGAGHIVPNKAFDPGLVFDAGDDDYDAFACGFAIESVPQQRCDDLAASGMSFRARDLNQPSIAISRLTSQQTVTRRVTNVTDEAQNFAVTVAPPVGMQVSVDPPTLALAPGQTATFDTTLTYLSGPLDLWRFGSLTWSSNDHDVRSTIAVK